MLALTFRLELTRACPGFGEVGRDEDMPSDKKGVEGSLMEKSFGESEMGEPSLRLPPFS